MKLSIITTVALLAAGPAVHQAAAQGATTTQTRPSDEQLSSEIATKIANDERLAADAVKVTVNKGVVTLTGMVGKDADKATAAQLARVPGVVRVENNLKSREKATDAVTGTAGTVASATKTGAEKTVEASKKVAGKTKDIFSKSGEKITDGWITSRVKSTYMADETLQSSAINVDTRDHVVTLRGAVPTEAARTKALDLAKGVEGVDSVVDNLKVTGK